MMLRQLLKRSCRCARCRNYLTWFMRPVNKCLLKGKCVDITKPFCGMFCPAFEERKTALQGRTEPERVIVTDELKSCAQKASPWGEKD